MDILNRVKITLVPVEVKDRQTGNVESFQLFEDLKEAQAYADAIGSESAFLKYEINVLDERDVTAADLTRMKQYSEVRSGTNHRFTYLALRPAQ